MRALPSGAQMMSGLSGVLDKVIEQAAAMKFEDLALWADRLYPDMFTVPRQIRQATDFARNTPGRQARITPPDFAATDDATLAAARERVDKSLAFVKSATAAQIEHTEDKNISWNAGSTQRTMKGRACMLHFCRPNLYFHTTAAYNILRRRGIEIGKRDFLGTFKDFDRAARPDRQVASPSQLLNPRDIDALAFRHVARFSTNSVTTAGSASVDISPRLSVSFAAILRRIRRMILPLRVFGSAGAH